MGASGTFNCSGVGVFLREGFQLGLCCCGPSNPTGTKPENTNTRTDNKKKSRDGERMSMGNVIKSLVQCESDRGLKQPFVGKRLQDLHEPDD